jgi:hypothetical protein
MKFLKTQIKGEEINLLAVKQNRDVLRPPGRRVIGEAGTSLGT